MDTARFLMACVLAAAVLGGCSTTVETPSSVLGDVKTAAMPETTPPNAVQSASAGLGSNQNNLDAEMAIEGDVSDGCLKAWRTGLAGDEKGAMRQLDALGQKYPNVPTISFMKGQVLDHFGKKAEAIEFYRLAVTAKEFSTIHVFKLAEDLRATKHDKEAVIEYRRLLGCQPDFAAGRIGLARALLDIDKSSSEAKKELQTVLAADPNNKDAQKLLKGMTN